MRYRAWPNRRFVPSTLPIHPSLADCFQHSFDIAIFLVLPSRIIAEDPSQYVAITLSAGQNA